MSENDVLLEDETSGDQGTPSKGIPKAVWYAGGGILVIVALGVLWYFFGARLFGGGDPIAEITPGDTILYMSVDFLKLQSEETDEILQVFQEMSHAEEATLIEALDEYMADEFEMSFSDDVMPWVGQYGALIAGGDLDLYNEDYEYMFVIEVRNKGGADQFIEDFIEKLDHDQGMQFKVEEKDGITLYVHEDEYGDDAYITREGRYVYLANSEDVIFDSVNLKKDDSLASTDGYKKITAELPDNRIALMYFGENFFQAFFDAMAEDLYYSDANSFENIGWGGMGMSMSVQDVGLQFDLAVAYDEETLSDYQRDTLSVGPTPPETDKLVPGNTFFYLGANQRNRPNVSLEDNPLYSEDMKESFELFEDQYGISIEEFINMFTGEFALALAPARDGVIAELGGINLGLIILASTNDEAGFSKWFGHFLDTVAGEVGLPVFTQDATIGDYELKELVLVNNSESFLTLYYGASNGYIIIGTSEDMLEDGLGGEDSLADSERYQNTWKAFPSDSVPYMYVNMLELFDLIKDTSDSYTTDEIHEIEGNLEKMPVIAMVTNQPSGYTWSFTTILFIETETNN
jgi:hypothetical protein